MLLMFPSSVHWRMKTQPNGNNPIMKLVLHVSANCQRFLCSSLSDANRMENRCSRKLNSVYSSQKSIICWACRWIVDAETASNRRFLLLKTQITRSNSINSTSRDVPFTFDWLNIFRRTRRLSYGAINSFYFFICTCWNIDESRSSAWCCCWYNVDIGNQTSRSWNEILNTIELTEDISGKIIQTRW